MFFANDKNGNRTEIFDVVYGDEYFCPICNQSLIVKSGLINTPHFAHKQGGCSDTWHYEMSEWHRKMQGYFPKECREVVVSDKHQTHRADVKINDVVIEFQYSPISADEFKDRNDFFGRLGYRVAWVFNLEDQVLNGTLYESPKKENIMIWKYPMRIFAEAPQPSDYNKKFAIWFNRTSEGRIEDSDDTYEYIDKVVWAVKNDYGQPSYKRFVLGDFSMCLDLDEKINVNHFFFSKKDYFLEALSELKEKSSYQIKYIGEKGHPQNTYICPLRADEFGIKLYRKKGCLKCRYCAMVAHKVSDEEEKWAVYCCFPNRINFYDEDHELDAPIYDL